MRIVRTIAETRDVVGKARTEGKIVGLVPTMGYFHEGHLTLMRQARRETGLVVVSLFVNPTQFGPAEDFGSYPRDLERDASLAESVGVDLIFSPSLQEMYPERFSSHVGVEGLTEGLCGASRPYHFRGVTTVVAKLFNIVQPDRAYFGTKDYQQFKVIERMVKDLNMRLDIIPIPTVREPDGLAMSSRNTYLNPEERQAALILRKSLDYARELAAAGQADARKLRAKIEEFIGSEPLASIDYVAVVDPETLKPVDEIGDEGVLVALAVRIGRTRLIDNEVVR
jgi:pantoate--beta-alanine ligase